MANKNANNENKNNVVANQTMTNEQMEQFVKDNISIVPRNQAKKFESLKLEQKVSKIRFYIDIQKMKDDAREKNKLENKVKDLFVRRKATTEDVLRVIEFCKQYIETSKVDEMNKLQAEIDRLTDLKRALENN
jgi:hypothetical protein